MWSRFYYLDSPEDSILELERDGLFNYELSGEKFAPIEINHEKFKFIRAGYDYLMKT